MAISNDFHTRTFRHDLIDENANSPTYKQSVGWTDVKYSIRRSPLVTDGESGFGYFVLMHQRIVVPSRMTMVGKDSGAKSTPTQIAYLNYAAKLTNDVRITVSGVPDLPADNPANEPLARVRLLDVSPRVANATHTEVENNSTGVSNMKQKTRPVETKIGPFSLDLTSWSGLLGSLAHLSPTPGTGPSPMASGASQTSTNSADSATSSMKDWMSACSTPEDSRVIWTWGQQYPWDTLADTQAAPPMKTQADVPAGIAVDGSGTILNRVGLPKAAWDRMAGGDLSSSPVPVGPPSDISCFGLDFSMTAMWFVEPAKGVPVTADNIRFVNKINLSRASHWGGNGEVLGVLDDANTRVKTNILDQPSFSASDYALEPVGTGDTSAVIGFTVHDFLKPPPAAGTKDTGFAVVSPGNTLKVSGNGFVEGMTTPVATPAKFRLTFKIPNRSRSYLLSLKHWVDASTNPCRLKIAINGKWTEWVVVEHARGQGGQDNISTIDLRDPDIASATFHDYLVLGTNVIEIDATPVGTYCLFAVAID